jgi:metal-dependent amidase/aminoacylase/carboxypeptidase family protein
MQHKMDTRFQANENDETAVHFIKTAKKITLNYWKKQTFTWEDFGLFTQHFKGAMFGLGSGSTRSHNQTTIFQILLQQEYLFSIISKTYYKCTLIQ